MTYEEESKAQQAGYAEQLQELTAVQVSEAPINGGPFEHPIGEGEHQKIPLNASVDGAPMDVIGTISIGNKVEDNGSYRAIGYPNRNGNANAVNFASKNFALVRTPYSSERPYLLELNAEDLQSGTCNFDSSDPSNEGRTFVQMPDAGEPVVELRVPVSDQEWVPTVDVLAKMTPQGDLDLNAMGNDEGYVIVATQN